MRTTNVCAVHSAINKIQILKLPMHINLYSTSYVQAYLLCKL